MRLIEGLIASAPQEVVARTSLVGLAKNGTKNNVINTEMTSAARQPPAHRNRFLLLGIWTTGRIIILN